MSHLYTKKTIGVNRQGIFHGHHSTLLLDINVYNNTVTAHIEETACEHKRYLLGLLEEFSVKRTNPKED